MMLLIWKLQKTKSCVGVSCRMQELYLIVFVFRYLDLLWSYISVYNTVMKVVFISSTVYLIHLMRFKTPISQTYERSKDSFPYEMYLLVRSWAFSPPRIMVSSRYCGPFPSGSKAWPFCP